MSYEDMTVSELMTFACITIREDETLESADDKMREADIRHLPVVDDQAHVVGILSDRDVLRELGGIRSKRKRIGNIMTEDVVSVRTDTRACEATALMLDNKIGALPVVNEEMQLIGLLTETDFLRIAHSLLGGDQLSVEETGQRNEPPVDDATSDSGFGENIKRIPF